MLFLQVYHAPIYLFPLIFCLFIAMSTSIFSIPIRIYWEDTDAGGIVYHSNYVNFMERSRTEWLRSFGLNQLTLREQYQGMFVVSDVSVRFIAPAKLDDVVLASTALKRSGRASFELEQGIYRTTETSENHTISNAQPLCTGKVRIGWVDSESLRPGRIPESILQLLS